jgi:hypothetical protein
MNPTMVGTIVLEWQNVPLKVLGDLEILLLHKVPLLQIMVF